MKFLQSKKNTYKRYTFKGVLTIDWNMILIKLNLYQNDSNYNKSNWSLNILLELDPSIVWTYLFVMKKAKITDFNRT